MPIHFQSIYRRRGQVIREPLCEQMLVEGIEERLSPLRSDVTCSTCHGFLMCIKESSNA